MPAPFARYREIVPCEPLRSDVFAFFSFLRGSTGTMPARRVTRDIAFRTPVACAPQLADGHVSITFELGHVLDSGGHWRVDSTAVGGTVLGPLSGVGRTTGLELRETVGAYFLPGAAARFFDLAQSELSDTAVAVDDLWGRGGSGLASRLAGLTEAARITLLESELLARRADRRHRESAIEVTRLATRVFVTQGRPSVDAMARAAGVSRQHLTRVFRDQVGIGPCLYRRLARFQALLAYAGSRATPDWARVAVDAGYADQSHMIAECRQFSGLTPGALATRDWFHPFIERVRATALASDTTPRELHESLSRPIPP